MIRLRQLELVDCVFWLVKLEQFYVRELELGLRFQQRHRFVEQLKQFKWLEQLDERECNVKRRGALTYGREEQLRAGRRRHRGNFVLQIALAPP